MVRGPRAKTPRVRQVGRAARGHLVSSGGLTAANDAGLKTGVGSPTVGD